MNELKTKKENIMKMSIISPTLGGKSNENLNFFKRKKTIMNIQSFKHKSKRLYLNVLKFLS